MENLEVSFPMNMDEGRGSTAFSEKIPPAVAAGILLVARDLCGELELSRARVHDILDHTGASRAQAYVYKRRLREHTSSCRREPGRPRANAIVPVPRRSDVGMVAQSVMHYLMTHPGAVVQRSRRRHYSDGFRHLVVWLCRTRCLHLPEIARAIAVPLSTLQRWMARCEDADALYTSSPSGGHEREISGCRSAHTDDEDSADARTRSRSSSRSAWAIVQAWENWKGTLTDFCRHLDEHLHIRIGRSSVARILSDFGVRQIRRRGPRAPARLRAWHWRASFERFFPGAQWVGDGAKVSIRLDGQAHAFNLELMVDTADGALVGTSIRDTEDGTAVVEAFHDGVATTGAAPLSLLLDNRPSNHSKSVTEALGTTQLQRATPGRPQNKAHVEGAFGLFKQVAPPLQLALDGASQRDVARQILAMIIKTWARTLNHRRSTRNSRVALYRDGIGIPEQVDAARSSFCQRAQAKLWRSCESHPLYQLVCSELIRLGLSQATDTPRAHARFVRQILRYPAHVITDGFAVYDAKRAVGTAPQKSGIRYLVGIMRRLTESREGSSIARALWRSRRAANAAWGAALQARRTEIAKRYSAEHLPVALIDAALTTQDTGERHFWLDAAADELKRQSTAYSSTGSEQRRTSDEISGIFGYELAVDRIVTAYSLPYRRRLALLQDFVARLIPLRPTVPYNDA